MLIEKVKIENFGPFAGKHELDFSINEQKKLNVILGLNGSGKTQLFNLMSWCLYGLKGAQFHENPKVEPLFLSDSIANNLSNDQTATTKVEMNLIFENKPYVAKAEVRFKKIDGKITVDSKKTKYSKYLDSIFPYPPLIFVNNIGKVVEKFNQEKINSEKLDKVIDKMNLIRKKSPFKYFENSEFRNIESKIKLIRDGEPLYTHPAGIKATLDYMFLLSVRDILFPNSVLIIDDPFHYTPPEFIIPITNFLLEYLPQVIFFITDSSYQYLEMNQGIAYGLLINQETFSTIIKKL